MTLIIDVLSWACFLAGGLFLLAGAIGVVRFPDFFTRMHAAGISDTLGAGLTILGMILQSGLTLNAFKLVTILVFLWFTSPVSSHALAHSAIVQGLKPWLRGGKKDAEGGPGKAGQS